ncbi:hypothetical protein NOF55_16795 [Rhizobiaceae bacterium BDR2-2]|uniref:Uncharacterized protein n=1 Tax=Ectorhizobium quercum TaxID=2965071 RepID=A0AAE3N107_9HYPH|nr:hypothetical protein [Ectorhizobium quercum]MCX8996188.1 hypothetical protein [Ectorhizobium quercum]MCX8998773.1 hypothetical protein [Ectorhizobium quercum]
MIFVATFGIGLAAGLTRSILSVVAASVAILVTFALAATLGGGASLMALLVAIGGYNVGLIANICVRIAGEEPSAEEAR